MIYTPHHIKGNAHALWYNYIVKLQLCSAIWMSQQSLLDFWGRPILFSEIGFCMASCSYIYIYIYIYIYMYISDKIYTYVHCLSMSSLNSMTLGLGN